MFGEQHYSPLLSEVLSNSSAYENCTDFKKKYMIKLECKFSFYFQICPTPYYFYMLE